MKGYPISLKLSLYTASHWIGVIHLSFYFCLGLIAMIAEKRISPETHTIPGGGLFPTFFYMVLVTQFYTVSAKWPRAIFEITIVPITVAIQVILFEWSFWEFFLEEAAIEYISILVSLAIAGFFHPDSRGLGAIIMLGVSALAIYGFGTPVWSIYKNQGYEWHWWGLLGVSMLTALWRNFRMFLQLVPGHDSTDGALEVSRSGKIINWFFGKTEVVDLAIEKPGRIAVSQIIIWIALAIYIVNSKP